MPPRKGHVTVTSSKPDLSGRRNLDDVAGSLARVAQLFRPRVRNTLERLSAYEGLPRETLFPAPSELPPVSRRRRWRIGRMESEDLSFPSQHDPLEPHFRRYYHARRRRIQTVTARRIRPAGARERPRLLYLHGFMQPETWIEELALLTTMAAVLDVEVVQLQPPYHGSRRPRGSRLDGELYWTADVVRSIESLRQSLLDARSLLLWLQAESPTPVGICGLSLGGALSAALTCLEPGFAFSAPFIAHMDIGSVVAHAPVLSAMREDLRRFGWGPEDFSAFMERTGWNALAPVLPRERILLFGASQDHFFRPAVLEDMWERWGRPRIEWFSCSHMGFIAHLPYALGRLRRFVDEIAAS
jgi:pimeloyl-ACP methyl ester carboxylesterase